MGSVVISLDAELGWGFHHDDSVSEAFLRDTRQNWRRLRELFDAYEIPATWAVTGHLFLRSCTDSHRNHPAGERCCQDPIEDLLATEIWHGAELVDEIATADVDHEIAGHGFTHVHFDHDRMNDAFATREIENCARAATRRGHDLSSFVFPVNRVRYRDVLADHGFDCYRGANPRRDARGTLMRQLTKVSSAAIGKPSPPIVDPYVDDHGLVNVPASIYLFNFEATYRKLFSAFGEDPVVKQVKSGIDRAARTDGVLHMWFHPHNLRTRAHYRRLRSIAGYINRRRSTDDLRVETMGEVAERVRDERRPGTKSANR